MTKFDNLFNSIINENEDRYMPGFKNTHSTKEEINSQINSYVQELQQSENFDQTVQDVIETAVMLIRGKRTEHCLEMFNIFKKVLPDDLYRRLLTTAVNGNIDERLKNEFKNIVLPTMKKVLG
jgi:oligoribonuclease NrnB/cAMP/cGMP phosphodiesterase (DHH superfamily)